MEVTMAIPYRPFTTTDYTTSYTSDEVATESFGNNSYAIVQIDCNTGDTAILQGRLHDSLDWIDLVTVLNTAEVQQVALMPHYRLVVTNTSGLAVNGGIVQ
jgi:hypothetical protein